MKFIPNSTLKEQMLREIGNKSINELFKDIPKEIQINQLKLDNGISQLETEQHLRSLANKNKSCFELLSFAGGGIKQHYIPAVVKTIISRGEFFTAYTPYQSEASQGFLKAMFEYQSMIASITNMDVANCSLYDGATALGEAALMATRITKRKKFLIPANISWEKKSILYNYVKGAEIEIIEVPFNQESGCIDINHLTKSISDQISAVYIENPNFFGIFEQDIAIIEELVHKNQILFILGFDPLSLGVIKSPGDVNADIAIGEGRSLGNPMAFGGEGLGLFTCKKKYIRQMPGRIIGLTKDKHGTEAFCMILQTREQHIRRAKATSNICTNEGLCALAATAFLAWYGSTGFQQLSKKNFQQGQLLKDKIIELDDFSLMFNGIHFNEFVVQSNKKPEIINNMLLKYNIQGGVPLENWYPSLKNSYLFGISEVHTKQDIERFIATLKEVYHV